MTKKKLLASGFVYTLGNILIQGLGFITLPIFTRITSQDVFGQFNLYNSWITIVSIFIGLQLAGSLAVGKVKFSEQFDEYVVTVLTMSNFIFLFFFTLAFLFKYELSHYIHFSENYFLVIVVHSYLNYLSGFLGAYFIQLQKIAISFAFSVFTALSSVCCSIFLVYQLENDFLARVLGAIIPIAAVAIIALFYFYNKKIVIYNKEYARFALGISLPLIFHHLGHNILNQFDRIMIGNSMTLTDVALYSFGYNLGMIIQVVLTSLNTVWVPWYFEAKRQNNTDLRRYIQRYLYIGLFLTLGYLTIFPDLAQLMGGEKYSASTQFISLIVISYFFVFLYTFPVNIQFYHENTKFIPLGTLIAGCTNIALNLILIPSLGIYGAALATVLAYIILLIAHHCVAKIRYRYDDVSVRLYLILSSLVFLYTLLINIFIDTLWIRWSLGLLVLLIYSYYYREDLKQMIVKMKGK